MAAATAVLLAQQASNPIQPALATLTDDFTALDTTKWSNAGTAAVSGGRLVLTPNAAYSSGLTSVGSYDLTGSEAVIELVQAANVGTGTVESYFVVYRDNPNGDSVMLDVAGSGTTTLFLSCYRNVGGVRTLVAGPPYDPVAHRWLRIREASGTIFWDTSPDRSTWTNQASWVATWAVTAVGVGPGSGYYGTEPSPGTAIFDNFNVAAPAGTPATASGSLVLGGSVTASAASATAGSLTLGGTVTARAATTAAGTVTLGGTVTARAAATSSGTVTLGGTATALVPATAAGLITLSGLANAQTGTYITHTYVTAVITDLSATATLAGNGTSTAVLAAQQLAAAALATSPPAVATLAASATSTAALAGDGTSTAALADRAALAILQTTT